MKVKFNIDENYQEEKAEFWLKEMTAKFSQLGKELTANQDMIWCYSENDIVPVNFQDIFLAQVEAEKTIIYTKDHHYQYKGRLYQVEQLLPHEFLIASRSAMINYRKIDHLEIVNGGNIDAILKNHIRVQIARRRIKDLKERLGL